MESDTWFRNTVSERRTVTSENNNIVIAIVFNNNNEEQKECNLGKKYYIEYMFVTLSFFISSLLKEEEIQR